MTLRNLLLVWVVALSGAGVAYAQGCSQCRDTVSQTNPAVQSSYRTAIGWMIGAAAGVVLAVGVTFRRMR